VLDLSLPPFLILGILNVHLTEDWSVKGKFPPNLKPLLSRVAMKAIELNEYDEHFFNYMPILFPYNKFTMTVRSHSLSFLFSNISTPFRLFKKLIKRTVFPEHQQILIQRQEALLEELADLASKGFSHAQEEWEKSLASWGASFYSRCFVF
jgi:hypothetical protein